MSQCGDRVQCAITEKFQPKFASDVVRYAARNTGANENICQLRCSFGQRSDDQITTREMFHATRFGHRNCDVNNSWERLHVYRRANLICIIHAVLQTDHCGIRPNELSHFCRGRCRIVCFNAEKNERTILNGAHFDCCPGPDLLLAVQFIENETFEVNCICERLSSDENSRRARPGEHSAEITAHRARANNCNSRPFSSFAHQLFFGSTTCFRS